MTRWACALSALALLSACRADDGVVRGTGAPAASLPRMTPGEDALRFERDGRALLEYERGQRGLKPYLRHLWASDGLDVLRDEPPGHEHHHGLMFALGVGDVDFWGERYAGVAGVQRERELRAAQLTDRSGRRWIGFDEDVDWLDPRGERCVLRERRSLLLRDQLAGEPELLTWRSRLAPPEGAASAHLWGRPYFGLGLRFAAGFDALASFSNADGAAGEVVRGDERLTASRWCACTAELGGRTLTVALFSHPRNPRQPTRFFSMAKPFAYLSATLDLEARPLELASGEALELAHAVALWERRAAPDEIERLWAEWAGALDSARNR